MDTQAIMNEMLTEASNAAKKAADEMYGGQDGGACGFAWVTIYPEHKGNTKLGKAERKVLEAMGFRAGYPSGYQHWNPSNWNGQSIYVKEKGALAAANVLRKYGFNVSAGSRLD